MDTAKSRSLEEKKVTENLIENKFTFDTKRYILTFFGKIGAKDFTYNKRAFIDKKTGETRFPTFYGNLIVLCAYMERAELTKTIAINLLWHIKTEETLTLAHQHPTSLLIPVKIQDPYGQWAEGTPLQIVAAAGDRNTRTMEAKEKDFGLVERLRPCFNFKKPDVYAKQLAEWFGPDSEKATEKTMAPYIEAIATTCQKIIESEALPDNISWDDLLKLPITLQLADNFRKALTPDANHVVSSGFLFDMRIYLKFIEILEANIIHDNDEDQTRPKLGDGGSRKANLLAAIVYPALQGRSQRCDIEIFSKGIGWVAEGKIPDRLDYSNGTPDILAGVGSSHFFRYYGRKTKPFESRWMRPWEDGYGRGGPGLFSKLVSSHDSQQWIHTETAAIEITQPQPVHSPTPSWCVTM